MQKMWTAVIALCLVVLTAGWLLLNEAAIRSNLDRVAQSADSIITPVAQQVAAEVEKAVVRTETVYVVDETAIEAYKTMVDTLRAELRAKELLASGLESELKFARTALEDKTESYVSLDKRTSEEIRNLTKALGAARDELASTWKIKKIW